MTTFVTMFFSVCFKYGFKAAQFEQHICVSLLVKRKR